MTISITKAAQQVVREYKGVSFTIARANNHEYRQRLQLEIKRRSRVNDFSKLSIEDQDEAIACSAAGTVLRDWDNLEIDGVQIGFTVENAKDLLLNDPDAREFIFAVASTVEEYEQDYNELLQKKSLPASIGS